MAIITNNNVPPSLLSSYSDVLSVRPRQVTGNTAVQLSVNVGRPGRVDNRRIRLRNAINCGAYLAKTHAAGLSHRATLDFITQRKFEILNGQFLPEYFAQLTQIRNITTYYEPLNIPSPVIPPSPYYDPNNAPSTVYIQQPLMWYYTPVIGTGLPRPYPGYHSATVSGRFKDVWIAMYMPVYNMTSYIGTGVHPYTFISGSVDASFDAQNKGNKRWGYWFIDFKFINTLNTQGYLYKNLDTRFTQTGRFRGVAPIASSPYHWDLQRNFSVSLSELNFNENVGSNKYLALYCGMLPSMGQFYSLNSYIDASFTFSLNLYVPI